MSLAFFPGLDDFLSCLDRRECIFFSEDNLERNYLRLKRFDMVLFRIVSNIKVGDFCFVFSPFVGFLIGSASAAIPVFFKPRVFVPYVVEF